MTDTDIEREFKKLVTEWKNGTFYVSSLTQMVEHPAYLKIIEMGEPVLPLLFRELNREPDHWFFALYKITGVNPIQYDDRGNLEKMTKSWLQWGEENKYI
jgi:hypothetical protein